MAQAQDTRPHAPAGAPARPLSPFLTIWRWHPTMLASILHRFAGMGLYLGAVGLAVWLMAAAWGEAYFAPLQSILAAWYGQIALYLIVAALGFHLANGVRHLIWDTGRGFNPRQASFTAWLAILFGAACAGGLWLAVHGGGA